MVVGRTLLVSAVVTVLAGSFLVFNDIYVELQRTKKCDTTYINPSYEKIPLAGTSKGSFEKYSLVRYQEISSPWVPEEVIKLRKHDDGYSVLFVHGHLGSYEQMRSMASETAKEISRRYLNGEDTQWVDWYATDFNQEPSGVEPRLLDKQAKFVLACLDYLLQSAPKVVLVGYSMGGLVLDRVLEEYVEARGEKEKILMTITIGSPHFHLPSFLMPHHTLQKPRMKTFLGSDVPTAHVFSGPGDLLVPAVSAWSIHTRTKQDNRMMFEVDMDDIPGVWGTASHKGLVSCNQLVRRLVPLMLDSIDLDRRGSSNKDIYSLMLDRLTSHVHIDVMKWSAVRLLPLGEIPIDLRMNCDSISEPIFLVMDESLKKLNNRCIKVAIKGNSNTLVQISSHGIPPGTGLRVYGLGVGEYLDMTPSLSALPSMSVTEPLENSRHWKEVIDGIDWLQNSTWILETSGRSLNETGINTIMIIMQETREWHVGQGLSVVTTLQDNRTYASRGGIISNTHIIKMNIQQLLSNYLSLAQWFLPTVSWKSLNQIMPLKLVVKVHDCPGLEKNASQFRPILVSRNLQDFSLASDYIRVAEKLDTLQIPLWNPSLLSDQVYSVVDPRCKYFVSVRGDALSAISFSFRYQIYALPGVLMASSAFNMFPIVHCHRGWKVDRSSVGVYSFYSVAAVFQGMAYSRILNNYSQGLVPWIFLQTPLSILSILWLSCSIELIIKTIMCFSFNAMHVIVSPLADTYRKRPLIAVLVIVLVFCLHDLAGFFITILHLSLSSALQSSSVDHAHKISGGEWIFMLLCASPMVVSMSGGTLTGYASRYPYSMFSLERLTLCLICLLSVTNEAFVSGNDTVLKQYCRIVLSQIILLGSLFGFNFVPPFALAILGALEISI